MRTVIRSENSPLLLFGLRHICRNIEKREKKPRSPCSEPHWTTFQMEISLNMLHECLMRIMDSNQLLGWGKKVSYESKSKGIELYLFFTSLRLEREKMQSAAK